MNQPCETCARPIGDGATICSGCAYRLDAALADVCGYRGLAYDLDVTLSRQARIGTRDGSRPTEAAVPVNLKASEVAGNLKAVLSSWARLIVEGTGAELPGDTLTGIAAWMRRWVGWLRHHEAAAEAYGEIVDAARDARRVVDRPADKLYAGPCDCGEDLYARLYDQYVTCTNPVHADVKQVTWKVEDRRRWLLESAEEVLLTTTEISQALALYAMDATPEALRGYVNRKRLFRKGVNDRGHPLYRLGDVLDILQRQAERVAS